jgi:hypothetical protein
MLARAVAEAHVSTATIGLHPASGSKPSSAQYRCGVAKINRKSPPPPDRVPPNDASLEEERNQHA